MPSPIVTTGPFPVSGLTAAYEWHRYADTCINADAASLQEFLGMWLGVMGRPGAKTWGIWVDGELSGMIHVDPVWRSWTQVDGNVHICLVRRAWGQGIIDQAGIPLLRELFESFPTVQRLTAYTPANYRPSHRVAEVLGFQREGTLRDAALIHGRVRDLTIFGLTRRDWIEQNAARPVQVAKDK